MMIFAAMLLLGLITFCYRFAFISSHGRKLGAKIPPDFLQLLAPATFTAIIFNSLLASQDNPTEFQHRALVAGLSLIVASWTESILATLIFGLGLLYLLSSLT